MKEIVPYVEDEMKTITNTKLNKYLRPIWTLQQKWHYPGKQSTTGTKSISLAWFWVCKLFALDGQPGWTLWKWFAMVSETGATTKKLLIFWRIVPTEKRERDVALERQRGDMPFARTWGQKYSSTSDPRFLEKVAVGDASPTSTT